MSDSPWADQLAALLDEATIRQRAERVDLGPLTGLRQDLPQLASTRFFQRASQLFVVDEAVLATIRRCMIHFYSAAVVRYPSPKEFLNNVYTGDLDDHELSLDSDEPGDDLPPINMIGLIGQSGAGKSELLAALCRVIKDLVPVDAGLLHGAFPCYGLHRHKVTSGTGEFEPLQTLLAKLDPQARPKNPIKRVRMKGYRHFVVALLLDELQHMTLGSERTALVTRVLLHHYQTLIPTLFTANYSLAWRLLERAPQDTRRLLKCPIVLEPPDDAGWLKHTDQLIKIGGECLSLDANKDGELLTKYSGRVKSELRDLIAIALQSVLSRDRNACVEATDIERAYRSPEFAASREAIEAIRKYQSTGRVADERVCAPPQLRDAAKKLDEEAARECARLESEARHLAAQGLTVPELLGLGHRPPPKERAGRRPAAKLEDLVEGRDAAMGLLSR